MRYFILIVYCFFFTLICNAKEMYPILWNMQRLEEIKINPDIDKTKIITIADKLCDSKPVVVTNKIKSLTGNPHNYESLSSYYWPNPDNTEGPYINIDGRLNPEVKEYDRTKIDELASNLKSLSIAYHLTERKKYYNAFVKQLRAWFVTKSTYMTPNFEYAQIIKGQDDNHGQPHGLIDAYVLTDVLDAIRLVDFIKPIKKREKKRLIQWTDLFLEWVTTSSLGIRESLQMNNHGPAYDALVFDLAVFSNNTILADSISNNFKKNRIEKLINPDGSQPSELRRTRAFHYSALSINFMVDFCVMQYKTNHEYIDLLPSIISACNYLKQFIGNKEKFPYQELSDWVYNENLVKQNISRINITFGDILNINVDKSYYNFYSDFNNWIK